MDQIRGFVTKAGGSKSFFVAEVSYEGAKGPAETKLTAPGVRLQVGDYFVADGFWGQEDPKYARGRGGRPGGKPRTIFKAKTMRPEMPQDAEAARRWFGAIFTASEHGVTEASIAAFVARHGAAAALMCERDPELIVGVSAEPGRCRPALARDWGRRISGRRAVTLLETCGVEASVIAAIVAVLRDEAFEAIQRNPYRVAGIKNVGFVNADKVGSHIGVQPEDARRISAALAETLDGFAQQGHTYATASEIGRAMSGTYNIPVEAVGRYIVSQAGRPDAPFAIDRTEAGFIGQPRRFREAEGIVAESVVRMLAGGRRNPAAAVEAAIAEECAANPKFANFDPIQRQGVALCSREPFSILTGGPGTGKSAVSGLAVKVAERFEKGPILLCAPTGKAAKRLQETTKRDAVTIHRLLEAYEDKGENATVFKRNRRNPLPAGCLVLVDEASMIDATTMRALVEAMPPDGRLMLVGDRNQLPSVDAGAILADLLRAKVGDRQLVPQTELVNIYRQGRDSRIATGSVLVRNGQLPVLTNDFGSGLALSEVPTERICDNIEWLVRRALDADRPMEPKDIMVLAPQRKGPAGTYELNRRLAKLINPDGARIEGILRTKEDEREGTPLPRIGDRVMLTENDTDNDVMNGDIGIVEAAPAEKDETGTVRHKIRVAFDCGKTVSYPAAKWRSLQLAYAITVHKSQGSQYPLVIMPVTLSHQGLDRALVYTGWTRAERYLFLVGEREALQAGVERTDGSRRDTRLADLCQDAARRIGHVPPPAEPPAMPAPGEAVRPSRQIPQPSPRRVHSARPLDATVPVAAPPPDGPVPPPPSPSAAPVLPGVPRPRSLASQRPQDAAAAPPPVARAAPVPRTVPSASPVQPPPAGPRPRALVGQAPRAGTAVPPPPPAPVPPAPAPSVPAAAPPPAPAGGMPRPRVLARPAPRVLPRASAPEPEPEAAGPGFRP